MTLEQFAYLSEIIGGIVIVVTLIYLSLQVRQGAELLRSESRQAQVNNGLVGVYKLIEHPELGRSFRYPGAPYQLPASPWGISRRAPLLGEHDDEIFDELGVSEEARAKIG